MESKEKLIFPLQMKFQCGRMLCVQALCLHSMARQNCIRQFVTILSLNKTRDLKTEGFCTGSPCAGKTVFLYGHVLRAFFYAQAHAQSATPCTWKSAAKAAHRPRDEQEENLPCPIFTGKAVFTRK
ncbi:hypothetical protein [Acetatifactor muris]|uniref:hypothetical protein n=1 Tax=Acetatifactor muris TaxID=879566 RepID=UPI0023F1E211|nr:hypothetical protein [Acetatifactor muris]